MTLQLLFVIQIFQAVYCWCKIYSLCCVVVLFVFVVCMLLFFFICCCMLFTMLCCCSFLFVACMLITTLCSCLCVVLLPIGPALLCYQVSGETSQFLSRLRHWSTDRKRGAYSEYWQCWQHRVVTFLKQFVTTTFVALLTILYTWVMIDLCNCNILYVRTNIILNCLYVEVVVCMYIN